MARFFGFVVFFALIIEGPHILTFPNILDTTVYLLTILYNRYFCNSVNFDCASDSIPIHEKVRSWGKKLNQHRIEGMNIAQNHQKHTPIREKSDSPHSSHTTGHLSPRKRRAQCNRTSQLACTDGGDIHRKRSTVRLIRQIKLSNRDDRPSPCFPTACASMRHDAIASGPCGDGRRHTRCRSAIPDRPNRA